MKIVNILGGLGNQMFQYAFAIALKNGFPYEEIKINTLCFNGYPLHNGYEIEHIFHNLNLPHATFPELLKYAWPWPHYRLWQIGKKLLPDRNGMIWDSYFKNREFEIGMVKDKVYFDGYWQAPKFFEKYRKSIKEAFEFDSIYDNDLRNVDAQKFIKNFRTAFIHVRRGDYINHPLFGGICTLDYYKKGISFLLEHGFNRFVIFSNDIDWCKQNLAEYLDSHSSIYIDWNKGIESYRDMQLMSMCKGALIANSSFSWWGAWLGDMEIVICPDRWTNKPGHHDDILPKEWRRIGT